MTASTFYEARARAHLDAKIAIALRAALFLQEGDSMLIDAGTSLTPLAMIIRAIASEKKYSNSTHYTIMTHNRGAFDSLIDVPPDARLNIFQTGGRYDRDLNASFGHQAERAYEDYHPKWVFIGQSGIDADRGLFCHGNTEELSLKRIIFTKPAFCRVIIADYTKLGIPGGLCFGSSDKLTDNVDHCVLVVNDPHVDSMDQNSSRDGLQRFEDVVRDLSGTHRVKIIRVLHVDTTESDGSRKVSLRAVSKPEGCPDWMGVQRDLENWVRYSLAGGELKIEEVKLAEFERPDGR